MRDLLLTTCLSLLIAMAVTGYISMVTAGTPPPAASSTCDKDLEVERDIARRCDRVLTTCLGWQARVAMALDRLEVTCGN